MLQHTEYIISIFVLHLGDLVLHGRVALGVAVEAQPGRVHLQDLRRIVAPPSIDGEGRKTTTRGEGEEHTSMDVKLLILDKMVMVLHTRGGGLIASDCVVRTFAGSLSARATSASSSAWAKAAGHPWSRVMLTTSVKAKRYEVAGSRAAKRILVIVLLIIAVATAMSSLSSSCCCTKTVSTSAT